MAKKPPVEPEAVEEESVQEAAPVEEVQMPPAEATPSETLQMPPPEPPPPPPPPPTIIEGPAPVAVGSVKKVGSMTPYLRMVNDRASHFYFRRVYQILHSLGKYRA